MTDKVVFVLNNGHWFLFGGLFLLMLVTGVGA
jgi:hypothetical protein